MSNRNRDLPVGVLLLAGAVWFLAGATLHTDDAWITFRYARNLAEGNGYVYNIGEKVAGTTAPLYGIILAALLRLGLRVESAALFPAAAAWIAVIASLRSLFGRMDLWWGWPVSVGFLILNPALRSVHGNETLATVALGFAAFALYERGDRSAAFVVCGLLPGFRPDAALIGLVLAIDHLTGARGRRAIVPLSWGAAVFLPLYILWAAYYGVLIPNTFGAKLEQGHTFNAPFWKLVSGYLSAMLFGSIPFPAGLLCGAGLIGLYRAGRRNIILYVLLYAVSFMLLNPPAIYEWYQYPFWMLHALGAGAGFGFLARTGHKLRLPFPAIIIGMLLTLVCLRIDALDQHKLVGSWYPYRWEAYHRMLDDLEDSGRPPDSILLYEIGIVGYKLPEWRITDCMGLVHSRPVEEMIDEDPPSYAFAPGALRIFRPDSLIRQPFKAHHRYVLISTYASGPHRYSLYKYDAPRQGESGTVFP